METLSQDLRLEFFGDGTELHHVGMAVPSIAKAFPTATIVEDPVQKVRVAFVRLHGVPFELVEPMASDSPVTFTLGQGRTVYHLCYQVKDLPQSLARAKDQGFVVVSEPVPAVAFDGKSIAWICSKAFGLIELVQE